jgi:hypothetical protein
MTEIQARRLTPGQELEVAGKRWTVDSVVLGKKKTKLTVTDGVDVFTRTVEPKRTYTLAPTPPGAMKEWAAPDTATPRFVDETAPEPPVDGKAAKRVKHQLGGKLLATQTSDGIWRCPAIDDAGILSHLLTFHHVRFDGVSIDEARVLVPDAETTMTAAQAVDAAFFIRAHEIHAGLHAVADAPVGHVHDKEAK